MNVPNLLTLLRIFFVPMLVAALVQESVQFRVGDFVFTNDYLALAATALVAQFLETFKEFPPRQKAASFTIDQVVAKLEAAMIEGH